MRPNSSTIAGLGYLPLTRRDAAEEARLLYVAMTRSLDHLILTGHRDSEFVKKLNQALNPRPRGQAAKITAQASCTQLSAALK